MLFLRALMIMVNQKSDRAFYQYTPLTSKIIKAVVLWHQKHRRWEDVINEANRTMLPAAPYVAPTPIPAPMSNKRAWDIDQRPCAQNKNRRKNKKTELWFCVFLNMLFLFSHRWKSHEVRQLPVRKENRRCWTEPWACWRWASSSWIRWTCGYQGPSGACFAVASCTCAQIHVTFGMLLAKDMMNGSRYSCTVATWPTTDVHYTHPESEHAKGRTFWRTKYVYSKVQRR